MSTTATMEKPPTTDNPVFSVEGLWKVFGPKADLGAQFLQHLRHGVDIPDIRHVAERGLSIH